MEPKTVMFDILKLTSQLKRHEGAEKKRGRHVVYVDTVGKMTVGYGRNLNDRGLSDAEADFLLGNDIQDCWLYMRKDPEFSWFTKEENLSGPRLEVLMNMYFNLGPGGLRDFKNTLAAIKDCDYGLVAKEMLNSKWAKQVGYRAKELAKQMETDVRIT